MSRPRVVHDVIDVQRAELRLCPDLYSERVADAIVKHTISPHLRAACRVRRCGRRSSKGTRK